MPKPRKYLTVCHVNVRSLCAPGRLLDLEILSANHLPDVLCATETWLTSMKTSASVSLPGYQPLFRRDRVGNFCGGVAIYVRLSIPVKLITLPSHIHIEALCLQISLSRKVKQNIFTVYRPPRSRPEIFFSQLYEAIDIVQRSWASSLCLAGDFNANVSDWFPEQRRDAAGRLLQQLASSHILTQVIREATFGIHSPSPSLLDVVLQNKPHLFKSVLSFCPLQTIALH